MAENSSQVLSESDFNRLNIGQKRPNRPDKSKNSIAKKSKASGDPYKLRTGIFHPGILPPQQQGKVCNRCNKSGCDLSVQDRQNIFNQFRSLDYNGQNSVLASCIQVTEPKEKRVPQSRKLHTYKYSINSNGRSLEICKKSLLYLFTISQQRLVTVTNKLKSGDLSPRDKREKHHNRPNRIPDSVKQDIRDHISTFPTYESHYTRNQTANSKLYLNPEISVTLMYDLFIQSQRNLNREEAEEWVYRHIFATEFDLKIGDPKLDTCDTCDKFKVQAELDPDWNLHRDISKAWKLCVSMLNFS